MSPEIEKVAIDWLRIGCGYTFADAEAIVSDTVAMPNSNFGRARSEALKVAAFVVAHKGT